MYSRVGTVDWPRDQLSEKIEAIVKQSAIWIPEKSQKEFVRLARDWIEKNSGKTITELEVGEILKNIPRTKERVQQQVMQIVEELFKEVLTADPQLKTKFANRLRNDDVLASLLPGP